MMTRIFLFMILLFLLVSCENVIEIELPDSQSEIVVIAPFNHEIPWQVSLQRTLNVQDPTPSPASIEHATVTIEGSDGSEVELSHYGGGFYVSPNTFPKLGVTYTLTVEAEGFKSVQATDRIPDPVEVIEVHISEQGTERLFNIQIQDDGNTDNYYELSVTNPRLLEEFIIVTSPELEEQMRSFVIQDPLQPDVQRPILNRAFIRDSPFDGKEFMISLTQIQPFEDFGTQSVYIRTISKSYYEYFRSQIIQENSNNQPFAEPVIIKSNITNGHGIFAGNHLHVHGDVTYTSIIDRLVGTYSAIHYSYFTNYGTPQFRNLEGLSLGTSVHLTINDDYSTTGEVRLPVSLDPDNPSDEVEVLSLDGGYTILGNDTFHGPYMLNLYHSTDTALRDVWFELSPSISLNPQITPNPDHFSLSARSDWDPQFSELRFSGINLQLERIYNE